MIKKGGIIILLKWGYFIKDKDSNDLVIMDVNFLLEKEHLEHVCTILLWKLELQITNCYWWQKEQERARDYKE